MAVSSTPIIVLINCGSAKTDDPVAAKDLYTSNYFALKRRYAEAYGDRWAILSAKHHLLDPDRETVPYERSMDAVDAAQWAEQVMAELTDLVENLREATPGIGEGNVEIQLVATKDYYGPLRPRLDATPWRATYPFEGRGLYDQMAWLSDRIDAVDGGQLEGSA